MHPLATRAPRIEQLQPLARRGPLAHVELARHLTCLPPASSAGAASARPSLHCPRLPSPHLVAATPRLTTAKEKIRLQREPLATVSRAAPSLGLGTSAATNPRAVKPSAELRSHWADRHPTLTCSAPTRNQANRNGTRRPTRKPDLYKHSVSGPFTGSAAVLCTSKRPRAAAQWTLK